MKVSDAAKTIAEGVNAWRNQGNGFCVFGLDGSGGEWYSPGSAPTIAEGEIAIDVTWRYTSPVDIQRKLDSHVADMVLSGLPTRDCEECNGTGVDRHAYYGGPCEGCSAYGAQGIVPRDWAEFRRRADALIGAE